MDRFLWLLFAFLVGAFVTYCLVQEDGRKMRCQNDGGIYVQNEGGSSPLCIINGRIAIAH
jgi:hypothetical protein